MVTRRPLKKFILTSKSGLQKSTGASRKNSPGAPLGLNTALPTKYKESSILLHKLYEQKRAFFNVYKVKSVAAVAQMETGRVEILRPAGQAGQKNGKIFLSCY